MGRRMARLSIRGAGAWAGLLALVLLASVPTGRADDKANSKGSDAPIQLRTDPAFQKPIPGEFHSPKAQDLVDLVRNETGQRISLHSSVIQDRAIQGDSKINMVPAWAVLEGLARNQYIKGYWTKRGDEYVLIPTYTGPPPPLPPPISPRLRAAMDRAAKGLPPEVVPGAAPEDTGSRRYWLMGIAIIVVAALCGFVFWRRKAGMPAKIAVKAKGK